MSFVWPSLSVRVLTFFANTQLSGTALTKAQREKVGSFCSFVGVAGVNDKIAVKFLKDNNWNLEVAVEEFLYQHGSPTQPKVDKAKVVALFEKYKDKEEDAILVEGVGRFFEDIGADPADVIAIVIAWHLNAVQMGVFTREQFVSGFSKLGCDSLDKIKAQLPVFREELKDGRKFKEIYLFAFQFGKESTQKSLPLDVAVPLWQLLLVGRFKNLDLWCDHVQNNYKKAISKDSWSLLHDFVANVKDDFSNYDPEGAWPVIIDEFVEFARQKLNIQKA